MGKKILLGSLAMLVTLSTAVAFYSTIRYQELVQQTQTFKDRMDTLERELTQIKSASPAAFKTPEGADDDMLNLWSKISELEESVKQIKAQTSTAAGTTGGNATAAKSGSPSASGSNSSAAGGTQTKEEEVRQIVGNLAKEYQDQRADERRNRTMEQIDKELHLTPVQKDFINTSLKQYREQMNALFPSAQSGQPRSSREERQQQIQALQQQTEQKILGVLDYSQQTKYQELKTSGDVRIFGGWGDGGNRRGGGRDSGNRESGGAPGSGEQKK